MTIKLKESKLDCSLGSINREDIKVFRREKTSAQHSLNNFEDNACKAGFKDV